MKTSLVPLTRKALAALLAVAAGASVYAQTIPNPSFEADTFTVFPGYISVNAPITGWSANDPARVGLNPAGGHPFADNGAIPDGANVAFLQSGSAVGGTTLSTTISDLTPGQAYKVSFRCNARAGQAPILKVEIDGTQILGATVASVGGSLPYKYCVFDFTAAEAAQTLTLRNDAGGDNTVCVDDFHIAPLNSGWSYAAWTDDASSGVVTGGTYTHAFNFASTLTATINGVAFTGTGAGANPGGASFSTFGLVNRFANDGNNLAAGGSRTLANDFNYGGGGNVVVESITINGLFPGGEYLATIYSVGWENGPTRAATFSVGNDRLTVNQDTFGDNNGIRVSYHFVASSSSITLTYEPLQAATFHTYGFAVQQISIPSAPSIAVQPRSQCIGDAQPVTFSVVAAGSDPLTYEWRKDDVSIGIADPSFTIPSATTGDAGTYTVVVSNPSGSITSSPAILQVGIAITNPSFEVDTFATFPGYVSGNGPITGWNALGGHGVNTAAGPFADNGTIPDGGQVAFMQADGALSQILSGFNVGSDYYVVYYENARTGPTAPGIEVKLGDTTIVQPHVRPPVGGGNPYVRVTSEVFTADTDTLQLSFIKSNPQGGDTTALIDNVCVLELPGGTGPSILTAPQPQVVSIGQTITLNGAGFGSQPIFYQWLKDGTPISGANDKTLTIPNANKGDEALYSLRVSNPYGSIDSDGAQVTVFEPIPDLYSTGLDNSRAPLPDSQTDAHYTLITNPDGASTSAIVEDSTAFPIVGGPWLPDTANSKWIGPRFNTSAAAGGDYVYRTTIDLTDRDPSTVVILGRWSVDNTGVDILVNGVSTGNPQNPGFNVFTDFAIGSSNATFVADLNTIDFMANNAGAGYCGIKVEFTKSNVRIPAGILPTITGQPSSQTAVAGDTVLFSVAATGSQPLTYQWQKDGVDIGGQTGTTLTLNNVQTSDMGLYTVHVSNAAGDAFSDPATLCINYRRVPGVVFGTGTDDSGGLMANGAVDLHYILSESADAAYPGTDAIVADDTLFPIVSGPWLATGPKSKWIAPFVDQSVGNNEGNYTYQTFFDLTGYDLSQVRIAGGWAVDNTGSDILVNGVSTGITSPGFGAMTTFSLHDNLVAGPNVLDFKMNNAPSGINPTGLRVDLALLVALSPTITFSQSGNNMVISWSPTSPCQQLQAADDVGGPWTTITGASNPFTFDTTTSSMKFFKVVQ